MDDWPTKAAVDRAARAVGTLDGGSPARRIAEVALRAAGLPELMGVTQAAATLEVATGNLGKIVGLPAPQYDLPQGRFWIADAIRALASERRRARVVSHGR